MRGGIEFIKSESEMTPKIKKFVCFVKGHSFTYEPYIRIDKRWADDGVRCRICSLQLECNKEGCYRCAHVDLCERGNFNYP